MPRAGSMLGSPMPDWSDSMSWTLYLLQQPCPALTTVQPHLRALLTHPALPTALHDLTAWDLPAPLTLCSLAMKSHSYAGGNFWAGKISPKSETQWSSHSSGSDLIIKRCRGHHSQPAPWVLIFQFGLHPALVNPLITLHTVAFTDEWKISLSPPAS